GYYYDSYGRRREVTNTNNSNNTVTHYHQQNYQDRRNTAGRAFAAPSRNGLSLVERRALRTE
ncbi:MAG: hypothetical protein DRR15_17610, partial [Gammaproteobacteria bacterium]